MKLPRIQRKDDPYVAAGIGIVTGFIAIFLFSYLDFFNNYGFDGWRWYLPLAIMFIFVFGIYLGRFLSRFWHVFDHFARFVVTGFLSAAIDFGVINIFLYLTDATSGRGFALVRTIAFLAAFFNGYFWNKIWTFDAAHSGQSKKELPRFIFIVIIGMIINVSAASFLVDGVGPQFGFSPLIWANIASAAGISVALFWNFAGLRLIVFRRNS